MRLRIHGSAAFRAVATVAAIAIPFALSSIRASTPAATDGPFGLSWGMNFAAAKRILMSRKGAIYEGYSAPHGRESFGGIIFAGRKTNGVLLGFDDDRLTEVIIEMETEASQLEQTFEALEYDLRKKYGAPKTIPDPTNRQIAWSTASKSGKLTVVGLALVRPDGNVLVYYSDLAAANRAEAKKKKDI